MLKSIEGRIAIPAEINAAKESLNKLFLATNIPSGAKQAAGKGLLWVKSGKKHTSGAKARINFIALTARLKSCPDASRSPR
jgi:hypothetical protein